MGRYREKIARRNARYEYEIPEGALHCEIVTGTEEFEEDGRRGVRTWRGVRYLERVEDLRSEAPSPLMGDAT